MAQRSSIALFLATAGLIGVSSPGVVAKDQRSSPALHSDHNQLLANAVECVPIGEGENCERQTLEAPKPKNDLGGPAANDSVPTSNPGASNGSASDTLNLIERGDL